MAQLYMVQNGAMTTTAPFVGVTTSASLYTMLQVTSASKMKIVEWNVSFNGSALAAPFTCELVETGAIGATVTAYAVADVMGYDDDGAVAQTSGTSGIPLELGTALSGYTSSAEGSITATRLFDGPQVEPIGGYCKQFPLGREPKIKPGNFCRIRVKGDGATKVWCSIVFEV